MLRSLSLLGLRRHASAFLECLEEIYAEDALTIGDLTMGYWRRAITNSVTTKTSNDSMTSMNILDLQCHYVTSRYLECLEDIYAEDALTIVGTSRWRYWRRASHERRNHEGTKHMPIGGRTILLDRDDRDVSMTR